jgi:hypothetical protein
MVLFHVQYAVLADRLAKYPRLDAGGAISILFLQLS